MTDTTHIASPMNGNRERDLTRMTVWLLSILFVLRGIAAFWVPLMDNTEARYAEMARKMVETGDWITLQYDYGVPYWGKPPLSTWLSAVGIEWLGPGEIGPRFFILLISAWLVVLFWRFVQETLGIGTARISALIFASSAVFITTAGAVMMDTVLLFSLFIMMTAFWRFVGKGRKRDGLILFIGLGLGLLAKGLVVLIMAGLPIAVWLIWTRRWKQVLPSLPWWSGLALASLIALPWYVAAEMKTPGFLNHFIVGEHIKRYLVSGWQGDLYGYPHAQLFGMIWLFYLLGAAPWSLVVPAHLLIKRRSWVPEGWRSGKQKEFLMFLLCWAVVPGIFLTFARNIIWTYSLPAILPLAILLAVLIRDENKPEGGGSSSFQWIQTTLVAVVGVVLLFGIYFFQNLGDFAKSTYKPVIAEYQKQCPENVECHLWCFGQRVFSAEYYLQGNTRRIDFISPLFSEQREGRMDFIAGLDSIVNRLPDDKKEHIVLVKKFKRIELWRLDYKGGG